MNRYIITGAMCLLCTTAMAGDPALELRTAFINQYQMAAAMKGGDVNKASREASCMFDVLASNMTVHEYIQMSDAAAKKGAMPPAGAKALAVAVKKCGISK